MKDGLNRKVRKVREVEPEWSAAALGCIFGATTKKLVVKQSKQITKAENTEKVLTLILF